MKASRSAPSLLPDWVRRRPDLAALLFLLTIGGLLRLAFLFRAPAFFVGGDSQTYLLPAYELVRDGDWDLGNRRPPGYPLLLAGILLLLGEETRAISFVQHLLGLATVAATYLIGRLVGSRLAGLLGGLAVALSGPLLIYEHYVMAETLFTTLLTLSVLGLLAARASDQTWVALLAGALIAAAWVTRPAALVLVPLVPILFLGSRPLRRVAAMSAMVGLGFLLAASPWLIYTGLRFGTLGAYGFGNTLMWRLTREEPPLIGTRDPWPAREDDAIARARRYAFGLATRRELPDDISDAVRDRFALSDAEADRVLQQVAVAVIQAQPWLYLESTARLGLQMFYGEQQHLGGQGKEGGVDHFPNPRDKYESWWSPRISHFPQPPTPAEAAEFANAKALANLYQPHHYGSLLLALCLAGAVAGLLSPRHRAALFLAGVIALSLLSATALAGSFPRFRYPVDPLISTLAATGLVSLLNLLRAALARRPLAQPRPQTADVGQPSVSRL